MNNPPTKHLLILFQNHGKTLLEVNHDTSRNWLETTKEDIIDYAHQQRSGGGEKLAYVFMLIVIWNMDHLDEQVNHSLAHWIIPEHPEQSMDIGRKLWEMNVLADLDQRNPSLPEGVTILKYEDEREDDNCNEPGGE